MIQRIRDAQKFFRPQGQISFEEWQDITDKYAYAKKFMSDTNPIYTEMKAQLQEAESDIMENRLREVHNFDFDTNLGAIRRMFITPKKLQDDETVGQIKFLRAFFAKLESWMAIKEDYEKKEANGLLTIDRQEPRI